MTKIEIFTYSIGSAFQRRFGNYRSRRHDSSQGTWCKVGEKNVEKKGKGGKPGGSVGNAAYVGVYQSRGCRIREKRAELTVERVYVKSSTVIDSLPSSTLLWVDHEGRRAEGGQGEGIGRKGGGGWRGGGLLVFRPSALGTPAVPRRALLHSLYPSPPGPL